MIKRFFQPIQATPAILKKFGVTMALIFGLVTAWLWWRSISCWPYLACLAFALAVFGLIAPSLLAPFYKVWMALAACLSWVVTRLILSLVFFLVLTPMGVVSRVFGKRFLIRNWRDPSLSTYWVTRPNAPDTKSYEKQY